MKKVLSFIFILCCVKTLSAQTIRYVSMDGAGNKSGTSWSNALDTTVFRDSLRFAVSGYQFWVKAGIYTPHKSSKDSSFVLPKGVKLYGGFIGTETALSERNFKINKTILSGDRYGNDSAYYINLRNIDTSANRADNYTNIVNFYEADTNSVMDGFTISGATKYGLVNPVNGTSKLVQVKNCVFEYNAGAAVYLEAYYYKTKCLNFSHCFFVNNYSNGNNGNDFAVTIYADPAGKITCNFSNCVFYNNSLGGLGKSTFTASGWGWGTGNLSINSCTFYNNYAHMYGPPVSIANGPNDVVEVSNSILFRDKGWDQTHFANYMIGNCTNCIMQGDTVYAGTTFKGFYSNLYPSFRNPVNAIGPDSIWGTNDDGLMLDARSPGIDKGDNKYAYNYNDSTDINDAVRILDSVIDIGAYEQHYNNYYIPNKIYVDSSISSSGDGSSWSNAYKSLADALICANTCLKIDSVLVAQGTYFPAYNIFNLIPDSDSIKTSTFYIRSGLRIIGGYNSGGTDRNFKIYKTILNGDLKQNDSAEYLKLSNLYYDSLRWDNAEHVVYFIEADTNTTINGMHIVNGKTEMYLQNNIYYYGAGAGINSQGYRNTKKASCPNIQNCILQNNAAGQGAGIYMHRFSNGEKFIMRNCVFKNNYSTLQGSAIYTDNTDSNAFAPEFKKCVFENNISCDTHYNASINPIISLESKYTQNADWRVLDYCIFVNNNFPKSGQDALVKIYNENVDKISISNSVFYGNSTRTQKIFLYGCGKVYFHNSIFSDYNVGWNITNYQKNIGFYSNDCIAYGDTSNNHYLGNISGNYITKHPLFKNELDPDGPDNIWFTADDGFHLESCSEGINEGRNGDLLADDTTDLCGAKTPQDSIVDIGAYEANYDSTYNIVVTKLYVDSSIAISGDGSSWATAFKTFAEAAEHQYQCHRVDTIFIAQGTYKDQPNAMIRKGVAILGGYPSTGGSRDINLYKTILQGKSLVFEDIDTFSLVDGITFTSHNSYVTFDVGKYYNPGFSKGSGLRINDCIFTDTAIVAIYKGYGKIYISNCIFKNGSPISTSSNTDIYNCKFTGAAYTALTILGDITVNVTKCIFNKNKAYRGPAVHLDGGNVQATYRNCIFDNNITDTAKWEAYGGVIYCELHSNQTAKNTFYNCVFNHNIAKKGSIIYFTSNSWLQYDANSSTKFYNSTFYNNMDEIGINDGLYFNSDQQNGTMQFDIYNSIVWVNGKYKILGYNQLYGYKLNDTLANSISPDPNNIKVGFYSSKDPLFVDTTDADGPDNLWATNDDGLRVRPTSQAINNGNNSYVSSADKYDIVGNIRIQNGSVDIGAYECVGLFKTNISKCDGDSIVQGKNVYKQTGVYTDTLSTQAGYDSIVELSLKINPTYNDTFNVSICNGKYFVHPNSKAYGSAGTYTDTLKVKATSCDSIVTINLTVRSSFYDTTEIQICQGNNYNFRGKNYSKTGYFTDSYTTSLGCDSIYILHLIVNPIYRDTAYVFICRNDSFHFNNVYYSQSVIHTDTLKSQLGCDSMKTLSLSVTPFYDDTVTINTCKGDSFHFKNNYLSKAGFYVDTFYTVMASCDSIVTVKLIIQPQYIDTLTKNICNGNSYNFYGTNYNVTGYYKKILKSQYNCDSIKVLNLVVQPLYSDTLKIDICPGGSYLFNGTNYNTTGYYYDSLKSTFGCDSIIVLNLQARNKYTKSISAYICPGTSYNFNGNNYTKAGKYIDTLHSIFGCDSIITTTLGLRKAYNDSVTITICSGSNYKFNGKNYSSPGLYKDTLKTYIFGCDSIVTLSLYVLNSYFKSDTTIICNGKNYILNAHSYNSTGTYYDTLKTILGCDSVIATNLIVLPAINSTINESICKGEVYNFAGKTLYNGGIHYDTLKSKNSSGCDSVVILNLNILQPSLSVINQTICSGDKYSFAGKNISATGTYYDTLKNSVYCDSIVKLNLDVLQTSLLIINKAICFGDYYSFAGKNITAAGTYYDTLKNSQYCDSVVTLNLTVNALPSVAVITWNGTVLTSSATSNNQWYKNASILSGATSQTYTPTSNGSYVVIVTNNFGCASISNSYLLNNIGIEHISNENAYIVYPNPSDGIFNLRVNSQPGNISYKVIDVLGKTIINTTILTHNTYSELIDLSAFSKGFYFLQISENGITKSILKLAKE